MDISKELLKGSTEILILALLEKGEMYGYQMIAEVERASAGIFSFKEGTLYPILHTLESEGHVESYWSDGVETRRRKYYRITPNGRRHLKARRTEWTTFRTAVDRVVGEVQA